MVLVAARDTANTVTSGSYLLIGKATVGGADVYVGGATGPLAPDSVTQRYLQVIQQPNGRGTPATQP